MTTIRRGVCRFCGCTDELGCEEGCWWIDMKHTACSAQACVDRYFADHRETLMRIIGEIAVDRVRDPTSNEHAGMGWWNALTESDRAAWLKKANSARPSDAWGAYCQGERGASQ